MSQQNKTTLQSNINTQLADNSLGDITAADVRDNLINMTDSLLFNSGSQSFTGSLQVTGSVAISNLLSVTGASSFDGSVGKEVVIGSATTTNYFLLSAGQLFIRANNSNASSNTGLALQSGNSNSYDAQIFINGNDISSTSTIQFKTSNNGSLTTRAEVNNTGMSISLPTSITGSLTVTGSSTLSGNLTVTGNTLLGNQLTNTTSTSGSFTIVSNTNSSDRALTIKNATTSQTSGSVDITSTSNTAIPSVFLRTQNNSSNLMIAGTSNDGEIRFTGGELLINSLDGNMTLTAGSYGIILDQLPTSEPSTSGQLWLSGSAGSNSKVLCVRD